LIFLIADKKALSSETPTPLNSIKSDANETPSIPSPTAMFVSIVTAYLGGAVGKTSLVKTFRSPEIINLLFEFDSFPPNPFLEVICHNFVMNNFLAFGVFSRTFSGINVFKTILASSSLFPLLF
jgi:hypothetical protein